MADSSEKGKGTGEVYPITGPEGPEGVEVQLYYFFKLATR